MASYREKLLDPRWQKKRLEVLEAADWECESCEARDQELHVHHRHYVTGRDPWNYQNWELACLCRSCHEIVTANSKCAMRLFGKLCISDQHRVLGFMLAVASLNDIGSNDDVEIESNFETVGGVVSFYPERFSDMTASLMEKSTLKLSEIGEIIE